MRADSVRDDFDRCVAQLDIRRHGDMRENRLRSRRQAHRAVIVGAAIEYVSARVHLDPHERIVRCVERCRGAEVRLRKTVELRPVQSEIETGCDLRRRVGDRGSPVLVHRSRRIENAKVFACEEHLPRGQHHEGAAVAVPIRNARSRDRRELRSVEIQEIEIRFDHAGRCRHQDMTVR